MRMGIGYSDLYHAIILIMNEVDISWHISVI